MDSNYNMYLITEIYDGEYKLNPQYFGRTRFQFEDAIDEAGGKCFIFRTRDCGSVGLEQYGEEDFFEAVRLKEIAEKQGCKTRLDIVDEWVIVEIAIPDSKIKFLKKSS